jgi:undecaprenyl-diphosphatase
MSRSASAIIGGMLVGLNRKAAAEFSFLAAVPVLFAASAKESLDAFDTLTGHQVQLIGIGLVVSFVTALLTVKWFIGFVGRVSLIPFAWYRLALAALVVVLVSTGFLKNQQLLESKASVLTIDSKEEGSKPVNAL